MSPVSGCTSDHLRGRSQRCPRSKAYRADPRGLSRHRSKSSAPTSRTYARELAMVEHSKEDPEWATNVVSSIYSHMLADYIFQETGEDTFSDDASDVYQMDYNDAGELDDEMDLALDTHFAFIDGDSLGAMLDAPKGEATEPESELEELDDEDLRLLHQLLGEPPEQTQGPQQEAPQQQGLESLFEEAQALLGDEATKISSVTPQNKDKLQTARVAFCEADKPETPPHAPRVFKKVSSRTVIGGVERKQSASQLHTEANAEAFVEQCTVVTPHRSQQSQWLAGSLASGLRPQRRAATASRSRFEPADDALVRGSTAHPMAKCSSAGTLRSTSRPQFTLCKSAMEMDLNPDNSTFASSARAITPIGRSASLGTMRAMTAQPKQAYVYHHSFGVSKSASRTPSSKMVPGKQMNRSSAENFAAWNQGLPDRRPFAVSGY